MKRKTKPKRPKTLSYEAMMDLDLDQFFYDAIRDRSLYAILESLQRGCLLRVGQIHLRLEDDVHRHPTVRPLVEDEIEFFEDAAEEIFSVRALLDDRWKDHAPAAAHGNTRLSSVRASQLADKYLKGLVAKVSDPGVSDGERLHASIELAEAGRDMIWRNPESGGPNFEIPKLFAEAKKLLQDPESSDLARNEITKRIRELASQ